MVFRKFLMLCVTFASVIGAYAYEIPEYELEGNGTGAQGTYLVKVSVVTKDKKTDNAVLSRAAVHGVLFRGFSSKEYRQSQRPLLGSASAEASHSDFFETFFKNDGAYRNYVESVSGARGVTKVGKKYRISTVVSVNKDQLMRDLQKAGIASGLNSAF